MNLPGPPTFTSTVKSLTIVSSMIFLVLSSNMDFTTDATRAEGMWLLI